MKNSAIQWTDHTFNPWEGCTKVAPECKNCYAETLVDHRFGRAKWGKGQPRRRTSANLWKGPLTWNKKSVCGNCGHLYDWDSVGFICGECEEREIRRQRVFCLSLGDWLDEEVPIECFADLLELIDQCRNLDWQLLTKRPENWATRMVQAVELLSKRQSAAFVFADCWLSAQNDSDDFVPSNVWIGVSAGADIEAALDIPSKIHFLSCEPMLHALDTSKDSFKHFSWIIFGGESGKNARPCDVDWIRQGVRFCRENKVAAFVKQLGRVIVTNGITGPLEHWPRETGLLDTGKGYFRKHLVDSHGGDWSEWPEDLRVRELPQLSA